MFGGIRIEAIRKFEDVYLPHPVLKPLQVSEMLLVSD